MQFLLARKRLFFIFLFCAVFILYGTSLFGSFVFDDRGILDHWVLLSYLENLKDVLSFPYWTTEAGLYRPVTLLSYSFNIIIFGGSAVSFHFVNLLLYFSICVAIYLLVKRLFTDKRLASLSAIIFLVLPIHTEVVANITGRSELLTLLFSLLTLLEFSKEKVTYWRAGLWTLLALGSKESAIAVLPLILITVFIKEKKIDIEVFKKYFRGMSAAFTAMAIYFFIRFFVLGLDNFMTAETSLIENPLIHANASSRVFTALSVLWIYVTKTFLPLNLCSDYSYNQIPVLNSFWHISSILGASLMLLAIIIFFIYLRRQAVISFAAAIFLASFLPVSNILFTTGTIAGERLFFFPSLGFAIFAAFLLLKIPKKILYLILSVILVSYGAVTFNRQMVWLTEYKLFLNAVECSPKSVLSRSNAGAAYLLKGDLAKAQEELEISKAISPTYSKGLNNLGLVYWKQGKNREAGEMYHQALLQKYPYPGALENLALLYASENDFKSRDRWLKVLNPLQ